MTTLTGSLATSLGKKAKFSVLIACSISQLLVVLDSTVLNVALPTIASDLHLSDSLLQGVINAFVVTFAGLLLLAGRLSDIWGHKRILFWSLAIFGIASLGAGLAHTGWLLLVMRALQGLGAAGMAPTALALLSQTFTEPKERAKALGIWGAASGGGGALGVILGGLFVEYASWRVALLINVPIALYLMFIVLRPVPNDRQPAGSRIDVVGAVLMTSSLALSVLALVSQSAGSSVVLWGCVVVLVVLFVCNERWWTRTPILPLKAILNRGVLAGGFVMLVGGGTLAATFYFLTLMYQRVLGWTPLETGVAYLPLSLAVFVGAGLSSALFDRVGGKICLVIGSLLCFLGLLGFTWTSEESSFWGSFFVPSLVFGLGVGVLITSTAAVATASANAKDQGLVSGVLSTSQHLGGALGLAGLVGVSLAHLGSLEHTPAHLAESYSLAFGIGCALMVLALLASFFAPGRTRQ